MMANDLLAFRRRNIHERKAIRFVRGETISAGPDHSAPDNPAGEVNAADNANLTRYRHAHFGCLRRFSQRNGLEIRPLEAPYITPGELTVLRWLAEAQRQVGLRTCHFRDPGLKLSIRHCAGILKELGVLLPTQTLYIAPAPESRRNYRYSKNHAM